MEESASWRTARNPNVAGKKTGAGGKEKGKIRIRATRSPSLIHDLGDVEGKRCRGRPEGIKSGVLACPGGLAAIWPGGHEASASDQACSGQTDSSEGQDPGRGSGLFAKDKNVNAYATDANATRQTVARTVSPRAPRLGVLSPVPAIFPKGNEKAANGSGGLRRLIGHHSDQWTL